MSSFNDSVWDRYGHNVLSKNLFAFLVSAWTAFGILTSAIGAYYTQNWKLNWVFILSVTVVAILGTIISLKSDNPIISLLGYLMVSIPFGMMLGPVVATYTQASVVRIFFITTLIVVVLGIVGAIIPENLEGWASYLFGGLLLLLAGYFIVPIAGLFGLPIDHALTWMDWIGVLIFSGYVVYDWNRAMHVPYTMDNSIDCALAIYLDFINIFIRLLSQGGSKKSSD